VGRSDDLSRGAEEIKKEKNKNGCIGVSHLPKIKSALSTNTIRGKKANAAFRGGDSQVSRDQTKNSKAQKYKEGGQTELSVEKRENYNTGHSVTNGGGTRESRPKRILSKKKTRQINCFESGSKIVEWTRSGLCKTTRSREKAKVPKQ